MKTIWMVLVVVMASGCSTAGTFVLPKGTTLTIAGHETRAVEKHPGMLSTRVLSWSASSGAPYQLTDASGHVVRTGKLRTHFRAGACFFPPAACFVVPMGLRRDVTYDLTVPADGNAVIDAAGP